MKIKTNLVLFLLLTLCNSVMRSEIISAPAQHNSASFNQQLPSNAQPMGAYVDVSGNVTLGPNPPLTNTAIAEAIKTLEEALTQKQNEVKLLQEKIAALRK